MVDTVLATSDRQKSLVFVTEKHNNIYDHFDG